MLDVIGNAEELGKAVGVDQIKNTFVQLYGLETCDKMVREHTDSALESLLVFNDSSFMTTLANQLTGRTF
jgi:geranylgeranyl pyrophosphate synthase